MQRGVDGTNGWLRSWLVVAALAVVVCRGGSAQAQACAGDCDSNGFVRVNELITGVNIALDRDQVTSCPSFDVSGNLKVEVNELVNAVNNALKGCPASPTPTNTEGVTTTPTTTSTQTHTPTPTVTPTLTVIVGTSTPTGTVTEVGQTPTPTFTVVVGTASPTGTVMEATSTRTTTPTPTSTPIVGSPTVAPIARLAGATTVVVNSLGVIPSIIGAVANGFQFGGASGDGGASGYMDDGGIAAATCAEGGSATKTGSIFPGFNLDITLNACRVKTTTGFVVFSGRIHQSGFMIFVDDGVAAPNTGPLTAQFQDSLGMPTFMTEAQLTLTISGVPAGGTCQISSLTVTAAGTVTSTTSGGASASITFSGTTVVVDMITFTTSCVPTQYRMTLTGNAALLSSASGSPINVMFSSLQVVVNDSIDPATFSLSGGFTSPCFGGAATVSTQQLLTVMDDEICPRAGEITATVGANITHVFYRSNQNVEIDTNGDSIPEPPTHQDCLDPTLYECLA